MSSLSPTRFERVREDLLHVSLRQVTEDPEPGQPANLARRAASFTKNRRDLDNYQVRKAAERVAADKRKDDALRGKLNGLAGGSYCSNVNHRYLFVQQTIGCDHLRELRVK